MPGPGCVAHERGLSDPLTERMAHAIHDPAVRAREPRGAHTPIDVAVGRELPGPPPHVPDSEAVGNEARQGMLDRVLRLRKGSTPGTEQQETYDRPREGSPDHHREQSSRPHAGKDARLLPRVPSIAELESAGAASPAVISPDELERRILERLDALGPVPRAELLHVLLLPTSSGPTGSASSGATPESRTRRASDRLRGGPDTPGGAHRGAA